MSVRETARMIGQFRSAPLDAARAARLRAAIMQAPVPPPPPSGTPATRGTRTGMKGGAAALGTAALLIVGTAVWLHQHAPENVQIPAVTTVQTNASAIAPTHPTVRDTNALTHQRTNALSYALRGTVHMPRGESASNVAVWAEEVRGSRLDNFVCEFNTPTNAVAGTVVRTDGDGNFAIAAIPTTNRFVVKATPRMYPPALSEILQPQSLPQDSVDITVSDFGGRIVGKFTGPHGEPVTNVAVEYITAMDRFRDARAGGVEGIPMTVSIAADGQYVSQVLRPGWYYFGLDAQGLCEEGGDPRVLVCDGENTVLDVRFTPYICALVHVEVRDLATRKPIAGVRVCDRYTGETTDVTDAEGRFVTEAGGEGDVLIHPDYGKLQCAFSRAATNDIVVVWLAPRSVLAVTVVNHDGSPAPNVLVYLENAATPTPSPTDAIMQHYTPSVQLPMMCNHDGQALSTNVPSTCGALQVRVLSPGVEGSLICSDPFEVQPGQRTEVPVVLPPDTRLAVRFASPVNLDAVTVYGHVNDRQGKRDVISSQTCFLDRYMSMTRDNPFFGAHTAVRREGAFVFAHVPTNLLSLTVSGVGVILAV